MFGIGIELVEMISCEFIIVIHRQCFFSLTTLLLRGHVIIPTAGIAQQEKIDKRYLLVPKNNSSCPTRGELGEIRINIKYSVCKMKKHSLHF